MYQTLFFDLDGTLIDPKISITESVQYALQQFNIKAETDELIPFIGPPLNKSFQKYYGFDEDTSMQAVLHFREYLSKVGINNITIYEGIIELLDKLKMQKKTLVVVTSKSTKGAKEVLEHVKLSRYFDIIMGTKPDLSNADKPVLIKEALFLFQEKPKESFVMIGDREFDIFGAQANGIDSIAVGYGYGSEEELRNSNPTHIANTIKELEKLLLNNQV